MKRVVSDAELTQMKAKELAQREIEAKAFAEQTMTINVDENARLIEEIKSLFATGSEVAKTNVRGIMESNGIAKFDAETNTTSVLQEIVNILKA